MGNKDRIIGVFTLGSSESKNAGSQTEAKEEGTESQCKKNLNFSEIQYTLVPGVVTPALGE